MANLLVVVLGCCAGLLVGAALGWLVAKHRATGDLQLALAGQAEAAANARATEKMLVEQRTMFEAQRSNDAATHEAARRSLEVAHERALAELKASFKSLGAEALQE